MIGLERYWSLQAQKLDFESFVHQYIKLMILSNRETGLEFWYFIRKKSTDTLLEIYQRWQRK